MRPIYRAPKTPEETKELQELHDKYKLIWIGTELIKSRVTKYRDKEWVEDYKYLMILEEFHKFTHCLHPDQVEMSYYAIPRYVAQKVSYALVPLDERKILPEEVFNYFKSHIEYR